MLAPKDILDDRYRIVRELGQGGYGTVYLAEELSDAELLGQDAAPLVLRHVALKVLRTDKAWSKRLVGEVRALCKLNHPNIVTVYGYRREPTPYVAMEFIEGQPLSEVMGEPARQDLQRTLRWLIGVAEALGHAHARGVVHRDLKPHNILITEDSWPKVVDFGLSWLLDRDETASRRVGTPGYLAPELIEQTGFTPDHRVDVYGFGATLFATFAGASPFSSNSVLGIVHRQMSGQFAFPDTFPHALRPLVERCLDPDPLGRPRTAAAVAEELRRIALAPAALSVAGEARDALDRWDVLPDRVDVRDARLARAATFDHPNRGRGVKLELATSADPEAPLTGAFSYAGAAESATRRVHEALEMAWPGVELSLYGARVVQNSSGARYLSADGSTVPVLDPYFPIPVGTVVKAEGVRSGACGSRALVDARKARTPGRNLLLGNVVHDTLEALMGDDAPTTLDAAFERAIRRSRWYAIAVGIDDDALLKLRDDLDTHFDALEDWTKRERGVARAAEASRASGRYGIEGRIDLAFIDQQRVRILELKTGRRQNADHVRQLRCYMLMWDGFAEATGRAVEGELLYSANAARSPIQRRSHEVERDVILARNNVVALHRWFSNADTAYRPPSFGEQPRLCQDSPCNYRRKDCERQTAVLGNLSGQAIEQVSIDPSVWGHADATLVRAARSYYYHWLRCIEQEYRAASHEMGNVFRSASLASRIAEMHAVADGTIATIDRTTRTLVLTIDNPGIFHSDDEVLIHRGDVDTDPFVTGRVRHADRQRLEIACESLALLDGAAQDGWVVDLQQRRIGFSAMQRALYAFIESGDTRRIERLVLPHRAGIAGQRGIAGTTPPTPIATPTDVRESRLNRDQQRAIQTALDGHDALLVHGPPGTGKTTVIAELTARLVARGQRVLLAACTNSAVDTMLARVVDAGVVDVLRIRSMHGASPELVAALERAGRNPALHFTSDLQRETPSLARLGQRLADTAVFAATATACAQAEPLDALRTVLAASTSTTVDAGQTEPLFDVAIVDEASQLTEPLTLAPLGLARRFVLVGDDKQLPPVVRATDALTAQLGALPVALSEAGIGGLDRSLFERLRPHVPHVLLREQYRMNEGVQQFPNRYYYDGALIAADGVGDRQLAVGDLSALDEEMQRRLDPTKPSVWVDVGGEDEGRMHRGEADEIVRTVAALMLQLDAAGAAKADSVGVVAPFRAQCHAVRAGLDRALPPTLAKLVEVATVERFQGREKDAMLVSLVCREWNEFVMEPRRLNVSLTRARTKVIVFGARALGRRLIEGLPSD